MNGVQILAYTPEWWPAYQTLARHAFRPPVYQDRPALLRWLYEENPYAPNGPTDLTLAVTDTGQLAGCIHKLWVPWQLGGTYHTVPALGNLVVLPAQRRQGIGRALLAHHFQREPYVLLPNAAPGTDQVYLDFNCQRLAASRERRLLTPLRAGWRWLSRRFGRASNAIYLPAQPGQQSWEGYQLTAQPEATLLGDLAAQLNGRPGWARPHWDGAGLAWRFFHPLGPRYWLLYRPVPAGLAFAVLSLGPRRGYNIARLVAWETAGAEAILAAANRLARRLGAHFMLSYAVAERFPATAPTLPQTFFYAQDGQRLPGYSLQGDAADVGFEAYPPETSA